MKSFTDKVAAITGAGSGIGRALALALAKRHCHLALSDVNETGLKETAKQAEAYGVKVTTARVDVSDREAVHAWADQVVKDHGKCNMIFNNAGVAHSASVEGTDYKDFEWIMGINFWGVVHGTKAFLPHLKASGEGHVINISSLFGLISIPAQSTYNASKFAVRGYTEALRQELELSGAPVSATSVHPGGIRTNIARDARVHDSMSSLGVKDLERSRRSFEKMLSMPPEKAAEIILKGVQKNERRILVGNDARLLDLVQRLLPTTYQRLVTTFSRRVL